MIKKFELIEEERHCNNKLRIGIQGDSFYLAVERVTKSPYISNAQATIKLSAEQVASLSSFLLTVGKSDV